MKKIIVTVLLVISAMSTFAQDIITTKTGDEIQSVVLKVGTDEVEYKKWSNQDGPVYVIGVDKIFMIKYQNGEKDVFYGKQSPAEKPSDVKTDDDTKEKNHRFMIDVGYVTQTIVLKEDRNMYSWWGDKKFTNGIMLGVAWNTDIGQGFGCEFMAFGFEMFRENYSGSGNVESVSGFQTPYTFKGDFAGNDIYLSPIKLQYRYEFGKGFAVSALTGPTFDLAIVHTYTTIFHIGNEEFKSVDKYRMGENGELYKPFYINWDLKMQFSYKFLMIQIGTSFGVSSTPIVGNYYGKVKRPLYVMLSFVL